MLPYKTCPLCSRQRCWCCEFDARKLSVCQKCLSMEKWHKLIEEWNEETCQVSNLFDVVHFPSRVGESQHGVQETSRVKEEKHGVDRGLWRSDLMKALNKYFTQKWTFSHTHVNPKPYDFFFFFLKTKGFFLMHW